MMEIVSKIPIGKENAIHMETLAAELGVSISTIKKKIREARQQEQYEIASGSDGYWLPESDYDRRVCVRQMRSQAFSRLKSVKPMESSLKAFEGQESLSEHLSREYEEKADEFCREGVSDGKTKDV